MKRHLYLDSHLSPVASFCREIVCVLKRKSSNIAHEIVTIIFLKVLQ